jgi:hypothetical protein
VVIAAAAGCDSAFNPPVSGIGGDSNPSRAAVSAPSLSVRIDSAGSNGAVRPGKDLRVVVALRDTEGLLNAKVQATQVVHDHELEVTTESERYLPIETGTFRMGLRDTVLRQWMQAVYPVDVTLDSLIVRAIVTNARGAVDTVRASVTISH